MKKMIKRYEFIERTLYLIRKELEENLPDEDTLDEIVTKTKKIVTKIL
jgi:hypothetical protein